MTQKKTVALVTDIGSQICEAVGIDSGEIRSIRFQWSAGDVATIEFSKFVEREGKVAEVFTEYELCKKGQT